MHQYLTLMIDRSMVSRHPLPWIVLGQAFEDVANENGWALPHRGRKERNQHWDKIPNVRLGEFNYKQTNFQRFFYGGKRYNYL